jgi:hypothetical protein
MVSPFRLIVFHNIIAFIVLTVGPFAPTQAAELGYDYKKCPAAFVIDKLQTHDIVMLGTIHKRPRILKFLTDLIPQLNDAGVTHVCLEIPAASQRAIDHYIDTGEGLEAVRISPVIDCPEYRHLFTILQGLSPAEKPIPVAMDCDSPKDAGFYSRDECMANVIARIYNSHENARIFVIAGDNHALKVLDWEEGVLVKPRSINDHLGTLAPEARTCSIVQVIDQDPSECDFTRRFASIPGAVAVDCNESFDDWKLGLLACIALKPVEPCRITDGLIIY